MLPSEYGVSGVTCRRHLRDWQAAGVWRELHLVLLDHLATANPNSKEKPLYSIPIDAETVSKMVALGIVPDYDGVEDPNGNRHLTLRSRNFGITVNQFNDLPNLLNWKQTSPLGSSAGGGI